MLRLPWSEFALLDALDFSGHEKKVLLTLCVLGVAEAGALCEAAGVPTSKIYRITEKLAGLGLLERTRRRPALYAAPGPDELLERLKTLKRREAERFALEADALRERLRELPQRLGTRSGRVDLAVGGESHVKRHLIRLGEARSEVLSYLEAVDLAWLERCTADGFDLLRSLHQIRSSSATSIDHRLIFGYAMRAADELLGFLARAAPWLGLIKGVRYTSVMGHPFHVMDRQVVILSVDHPLAPERRIASLWIEDPPLAAGLAGGFDALWHKAMKQLREIRGIPLQGG